MTARRRASSLSAAQRDLYLASRLVGDANALQRGGLPKLGQRVVKRAVHRREVGLLRRWKLW